MIRTVRQARSFPSLKQATANQVSAQPQRSLASSVLLTSWTKARVSDLREELKKRGLSTPSGATAAAASDGKKADLLGRLNQHETSKSKLSPIVASVRAASSTPKIAEKPERLADSEILSPKEKVSYAEGQQVLQRGEGIPTAAEVGESPTETPGLPENPFSDKPATFDFHLPEFKNEPEPGTPIPWILAFHSDKFPSSKSSPSQAIPQVPHVPKLFTAADASTHLGGGPHAALSTPISSDPFATDAELSEDQPGRKLNAGERKGLYVLAGILAGGLGLGALTNPNVKKAARKAEREAEKLARDGKAKAEKLAHDGKVKAEKLAHDSKVKAEALLEKGKAKSEKAVETVKEKTVGK